MLLIVPFAQVRISEIPVFGNCSLAGLERVKIYESYCYHHYSLQILVQIEAGCHLLLRSEGHPAQSPIGWHQHQLSATCSLLCSHVRSKLEAIFACSYTCIPRALQCHCSLNSGLADIGTGPSESGAWSTFPCPCYEGAIWKIRLERKHSHQ